jgi:tyrosine-protein kinase
MKKEETVELRWLFSVIRRWAWLIGGCTLMALVIALVVTSRVRPAYEATTTLLVIPAEQGSTSEYNTLKAGEALALTYVQMLKEQSTLQTAISRLGLEETPEALGKRVKAQPVTGTQLVRVTARDSSPVRAALIANTIADIFTDYAKALQEDRYRGPISSSEAKIEALRKAMEETQLQIETAGAEKVSNDAELARLQGLLSDYRSTIRPLQQDLQSLQLLVEQVKNNVRIVEPARLPAAGATGPYTATVTLLVDQGGVNLASGRSGAQASDRLTGTYVQMAVGPSILEAAIASVGSGQSPDALAARVRAEPIANTQLVRLQVTGTDAKESARLADAIAQAFVGQIQEMLGSPYAARLATLQAEITRQSALIDKTQSEIQAQTLAKLQNESKVTRLQTMLAQDSNDYRVLQQDYQQLLLTATQASESVVISERAYEPQKTARNRVPYVLLAALIAMLVAFGIACLIEYLNESFRTPEDVSHVLGLGTLGMIEQFGKEDEKLVVASHPQSPAAEAFRVLAANIRLSSMDSHFRTILVTSPASAEGKSVIAANLAVAMANAGLRVVVVDADLRLPQQHRLFGLNRGQGLTDALWQGGANGNLKSTEVDGVNVLTSGMLPLDPVEAISSPRLKNLLTDLAEEADLVIIDSPPVLAVADATILAAGADGVLLVLRAGHTGGRTARRAVEALRQARAQLLGVVLNAVPVRSNGYYRYYRTTDETAGRRSYLGKALGLIPWRLPRESGQRLVSRVRDLWPLHRVRS